MPPETTLLCRANAAPFDSASAKNASIKLTNTVSTRLTAAQGQCNVCMLSTGIIADFVPIFACGAVWKEARSAADTKKSHILLMPRGDTMTFLVTLNESNASCQASQRLGTKCNFAQLQV